MKPSDFYVGYLAIPPSHRRAVMLALPLLALVMLGSAAALAHRRADWGSGAWEIEAPRSIAGGLALSPYPTLTVISDTGAVEAYLVVGAAKTAPTAPSLAAAAPAIGLNPAHRSHPVTITGYDLHRDGRRMISLAVDERTSIAPTPAPTQASGPTSGPTSAASLAPTWEHPDTTISLYGQILDAKCYLGAMQPGHGRGHKACATACIQGGIPPMLVTQDDRGRLSYHLLTDSDGSALTGERLAALLPFVADPVVLTGRPGRLGNWSLLAIDPADRASLRRE